MKLSFFKRDELGNSGWHKVCATAALAFVLWAGVVEVRSTGRIPSAGTLAGGAAFVSMIYLAGAGPETAEKINQSGSTNNAQSN